MIPEDAADRMARKLREIGLVDPEDGTMPVFVRDDAPERKDGARIDYWKSHHDVVQALVAEVRDWMSRGGHVSDGEREYGAGAAARKELTRLKEIMLRRIGLTFAPGQEPELDMAKALEVLYTDLDNTRYYLARRNDDQQRVHDHLVDLLSESTVHADDVKRPAMSVNPLRAGYLARIAADEIRHLRREIERLLKIIDQDREQLHEMGTVQVPTLEHEIIRLKEKFRLSSEVPQEAVDELVDFWHERDHGRFLDDAARDLLAKWWPSRSGSLGKDS